MRVGSNFPSVYLIRGSCGACEPQWERSSPLFKKGKHFRAHAFWNKQLQIHEQALLSTGLLEPLLSASVDVRSQKSIKRRCLWIIILNRSTVCDKESQGQFTSLCNRDWRWCPKFQAQGSYFLWITFADAYAKVKYWVFGLQTFLDVGSLWVTRHQAVWVIGSHLLHRPHTMYYVVTDSAKVASRSSSGYFSDFLRPIPVEHLSASDR